MKIERISLALTEASVTSPARAAPRPDRTTLRNTDSPLVPTIKAAQMARAMSRVNRVPPSRPTIAPTPTPAPAQAAKPSVFKRVLLGAGALIASVGVVGGFVAIVALGPIGLAVAAGAGVLGAAMIWLGGKAK